MRNIFKKPLALVLSGALLLGGAGAIYAMNSGDEAKDEPKNKISLIEKEDDAKVSKDETVYVLTGADGSVKKVIVSDWIKNALGSSTITDSGELKDVENVKGDESYTMNPDGMRVWDAQGNDIYCKGSIDKELPVNLSVSYKLDGKTVSADELAGKSGKVTIRFDYKNNQYQTVTIDGKNEKIYVPFAMLTGILLDNDVFTDVEVSNGKMINDGDRTAVLGIAFPGLQENLAISKNDFEIPSYVEITANDKNFEMMNTVTIATNEIFNKIDTDGLDSAGDLTSALGSLTDAMTQLTDGSSALYDGLCTLLDKSGELIAGIDKLAAGAEQLRAGANDLSNGATDLANGAKDLASGLTELDSHSAELNAGAKKVFETLLSTAQTELTKAGLDVPSLTIDNYAEVLNGIIKQLDPENVSAQANAVALAKVTEKVNEQKETIKAAVVAEYKKGATEKYTQGYYASIKAAAIQQNFKMSVADYNKAVDAGLITEEQQNALESGVQAKLNSEEIQAAISADVEKYLASDEARAQINASTEKAVEDQIEKAMNSAEVQAQITEALEKAKSGAASVSALKEQLDSYNEFYTGLADYTAGVGEAKDGSLKLSVGADTLSGGAKTLYAGMCELYDGIFQLKNGSPALTDGVTQLRDGALTLSDGLKQFNEQGVQKLVDAVDGDLGSLLTRVKATVDVSKDYRSFSGLSDDMSGQVKFIYRTDAIEIEK